jgi:hypothetical protein
MHSRHSWRVAISGIIVGAFVVIALPLAQSQPASASQICNCSGSAWNVALPDFSVAASQTGFEDASRFTNAFAYDNPAFQRDLPTAMFIGNSYAFLRTQANDDVAWNSCTMLGNDYLDSKVGITPLPNQDARCPDWSPADLTDTTVQNFVGEDFLGIQDLIDDAAPMLSSYNGQTFQEGDGSLGSDLGYALLMGDYSDAQADAQLVQSEMVAIENYLYDPGNSVTESSAYLASQTPGKWHFTCQNEFASGNASNRAAVWASCWLYWQLFPYFDAYQVFRNLPAECPLLTTATDTSQKDEDAIQQCQLSIADYLEGMLPADLGGENSVANPFEEWPAADIVGMDPTPNAMGWTNIWQNEILYDSTISSWDGCYGSLKSYAAEAWLAAVWGASGPSLGGDMTTWEDGGYADSLSIQTTEAAYPQVNTSDADLIMGIISGAVTSSTPGQQAITTDSADQNPPQEPVGNSAWPSWTVNLTCPST